MKLEQNWYSKEEEEREHLVEAGEERELISLEERYLRVLVEEEEHTKMSILAEDSFEPKVEVEAKLKEIFEAEEEALESEWLKQDEVEQGSIERERLVDSAKEEGKGCLAISEGQGHTVLGEDAVPKSSIEVEEERQDWIEVVEER